MAFTFSSEMVNRSLKEWYQAILFVLGDRSGVYIGHGQMTVVVFFFLVSTHPFIDKKTNLRDTKETTL